MGAADCGYMVSIEKPAKKWILRGLKLRGLTWNRIDTLSFIDQNDKCKKIYSFRDSGNETPTHIGATHAIPKFQPKFQNRIPRELDQNFYMPGIGMIH